MLNFVILLLCLSSNNFIYANSTNSNEMRPSEKACTYFTTEVLDFILENGAELNTKYLHMAAIGWKSEDGNYNYACGGSLIAQDFVLTAAHCTSLKGKSPDVALIGGETLNVPGNEYRPLLIKNIYRHPLYTRRKVYNDIALLELEKTSFYIPSCLWTKEEFDQSSVTVLGYGVTKFEGNHSRIVLEGNLEIIAPEECRAYYEPRYKLEKGLIDSQICAAHPTRRQDTCQGDSGGPLMVVGERNNRMRPFLLGVTSYGDGCAEQAPGVYTKVYSYLDWIESIVWPYWTSL